MLENIYKNKILIVGAGLAGATIARILSEKMGLNWRESISNLYNDKLQINNTLYPSNDTILESDIIKKDFLKI